MRQGRAPRGAAVFGLFLIFGPFQPARAWAWGGIGHRMVAETAALLTAYRKPGPWAEFLTRHRFQLGVYCFLPDSHYRHESESQSHIEGPTHFLDMDLVLGTNDFASVKSEDLDKKPGLYKVSNETMAKVGSAPWRVRQFILRAQAEFAAAVETSDGPIEQVKVRSGLFELGMMAHYSGDAAMPYHGTSDYNGWSEGLGGIHFYFENDCVHELEPGLSQDVLKAAKAGYASWAKELKIVTTEDVIPAMYRMFLDSAKRIRTVADLDRKHALIEPSPLGTKAFAKRKPPSEACEAFRPLLIERISRAAILTAELWGLVVTKPAGAKLGRDLASAAGRSLGSADFLGIELKTPYPYPDYLEKK